MIRITSFLQSTTEVKLEASKSSSDKSKEEPKKKSEEGVSKFSIIQLIQEKSDRVTFEQSKTSSAVWEKFLKISLDNAEVPFVSCKFCKKVYTHDRTLGTSSLLR